MTEPMGNKERGTVLANDMRHPRALKEEGKFSSLDIYLKREKGSRNEPIMKLNL